MTNLAEQHSELFHYTGINGVEGILRSQTLWATHARFLNDTSELTLFKDRLVEVVIPEIKSAVIELVRQAPRNQDIVDQHGGLDLTINEIAPQLVQGAFVALFGNEILHPFSQPYVASFCTSTDQRIAEHGLLSQWRAYGSRGGYAIVFDAVGMDELLAIERSMWHIYVFGSAIIYSDATNKQLLDEIGSEMDAIKNCFGKWLRSGGQEKELEGVYEPLIQCACRYKHWGFHEEKEVRIAAIPPNDLVLGALRKEGIDPKVRPFYSVNRGGVTVPTIHLFEGTTQLPSKPLPIGRIIVGPSEDRNNRKLAIENLVRELGLNINVTVSDIPYLDVSGK
jgi:hypothetical protein